MIATLIGVLVLLIAAAICVSIFLIAFSFVITHKLRSHIPQSRCSHAEDNLGWE